MLPEGANNDLLLPGTQPPVSHFGVTLLRHVVVTGLRYTLYHLGLDLPDKAPLRIHALRLYFDAPAVRQLLDGYGAGRAVAGALIMGVLRNGLNLLGISSFLQQVVIGTVGRMAAVKAPLDLLRASEAWLPDPLFDGHRHLRVQLFAAAHGLEGGHVAAPQATLAVPVEAGHAVPADVAERCLQVLDA